MLSFNIVLVRSVLASLVPCCIGGVCVAQHSIGGVCVGVTCTMLSFNIVLVGSVLALVPCCLLT